MNLSDPQDRSVAAGEYVMGTLLDEERAEFEAALAADSALQAEVYTWQDKLLGLALRVAPVEPDLAAWAGIESRLKAVDAGAQRASSGAAAPPSAAAATASLPLPTAAPPRRNNDAANDPAWRRVRLWQTVSGFAVAACLVLATMLWRTHGDAAAERYVTLLQAPDKSNGWLVEVTAGQRLRLVPLTPAQALPPGKSMQFWTKLEGASGPTSLGLVQPGQAVELPLARLPGVAERQLFELTLEPEAGSPLNRPTGPILYVGRSVRL